MPSPLEPNSFTVQLPWPPSTNNLYRTKRGGGVYMKGNVRDWYERSENLCRNAAGFRENKFPLDTRVKITLKFVPPTRRGYDLDNRVKSVYDLLQRAKVIENDSQVFQGVEYKFLKDETGQLPRGGVFVLVEPLPPGTGDSIWSNGGTE